MSPKDKDEIQRGNEGIDYGNWTGWDGPKDYAPYPGYPNPTDNPPSPKLLLAANVGAMVVGMVAAPFLCGGVW